MTARRAVALPRAGEEGGGRGVGRQRGCEALEWEGAGDCLLEFLLQLIADYCGLLLLLEDYCVLFTLVEGLEAIVVFGGLSTGMAVAGYKGGLKMHYLASPYWMGSAIDTLIHK